MIISTYDERLIKFIGKGIIAEIEFGRLLSLVGLVLNKYKTVTSYLLVLSYLSLISNDW